MPGHDGRVNAKDRWYHTSSPCTYIAPDRLRLNHAVAWQMRADSMDQPDPKRVQLRHEGRRWQPGLALPNQLGAIHFARRHWPHLPAHRTVGTVPVHAASVAEGSVPAMAGFVGAQHEFHDAAFVQNWADRFVPSPSRLALFDMIL